MATNPRHGKVAVLTVNGTDISAFTDTATLDQGNDQADTSAFGGAWQSSISGLSGGTFSGSGTWDSSNSTAPDVVFAGVITGAAAVPCTYKPGGPATGDLLDSFNAVLTGYTEDFGVTDKVAFGFTMMTTGAITPTVL